MAARSTEVTLDNTTQFNLFLQNTTLVHGEWTSQPPDIIGNFGTWRSESDGVLTGTEGFASYAIHDPDDVEIGVLQVHWDNPFAGANSYDQSVSPQGGAEGFSLFHLGGKGNDASVTFRLFKGDCKINQDTGEISCSAAQPLTVSGTQSAWRFCAKCHGLFFDGFPAKGVCPGGGGHAAAGLTFLLLHDVPPRQGYEIGFHFCEKCSLMFRPATGLGPAPGDPGVCPKGSGHNAQGFRFVLQLSNPGGQGQDDWARCGKCKAIFWDGEADKGRCAAGGAHTRAHTLQGAPETALKLPFLP
ncbi:MAG TPA: hypothetical protein VMU39_17515 [Solirubrobacteraceae bacterium]|nr:hypothetical protein [Solirubrobacteraceae bacterium]